MLGQDLMSHLSARHDVLPLTRCDADVTDSTAVMEAVKKCEPDVVIHAAAFTAVDECERRPELAEQVNAQGTRNVALACGQARVPVVYLSTDYVFDGQKAEPYVEDDIPHPINVYGRTKLEGERYLCNLVTHFCIVRTSWLFGPLGKNFVQAILEQAHKGDAIRVVDDQVGAPTYTMDLAKALEYLVQKASQGVYHVTNQGYCSWFEFAEEILRQTGLDHIRVSPIPSSASGRPAPRPRNSRLACARLEPEGAELLPPWQDALRRYLFRSA